MVSKRGVARVLKDSDYAVRSGWLEYVAATCRAYVLLSFRAAIELCVPPKTDSLITPALRRISLDADRLSR